MQFKKIIIPILILFYAGIRIYLLPFQILGNDEKRDIEIVQSSIQDDRIIYHGARFSHMGHIPSPVYYNLLTWGYKITDSITGMRLMVVLFNFIGAGLLLYFLRNYKSFRFIILYGVFIAVSPWLVKYTSFSWNPNFLPFVSAVYLISGYKTLTNEKSSWIAITLISLFFGISMHIITMPYILAFGVLLLLFARKVNLLYFSIAIIVISFLLLTYVYLDYRNGWWNTQLLFLAEDSKPYQFESLKIIQHLLLFTTVEVSHFIERGFANNVNYWYPPLFQAILFVFFLIMSCLITLASHHSFFSQQWKKIKTSTLKKYCQQNPLTSFITVNLLFLILFAIGLGRGFEPRYGLIAIYFMLFIVVDFVDKFLEKIKHRSNRLYYISLSTWVLFMFFNLYLSFKLSLPNPLNHLFY